MDGLRIFLLYTPADYQWSQQLAEQLKANGYLLYLEPPEGESADGTVQRRTTAALHRATVMIVVVSKESAIGESATVFEQWWRPFIESGRKVIACIIPTVPPGAEHWMPFDLYRQGYIDFRLPNAYSELCAILGTPPRDQQAALAVTSLKSTASSVAAEVEIPESLTPNTATLGLPQQESAPELAGKLPEEPSPGLLRSLFSSLVGLSIVLFIWLAAIDASGSTPIKWLAGIVGLMGSLFLLAQLSLVRRKREQRLEWRRQMALTRGKSCDLEKLGAYLEVIESPMANEIGQIWPLGETTTIGYSASNDIVLQDGEIGHHHCLVYQNNGQYYLENKSLNRRVVLYGRQLQVDETIELQNGDLISLGKATVLQLRTPRHNVANE